MKSLPSTFRTLLALSAVIAFCTTASASPDLQKLIQAQLSAGKTLLTATPQELADAVKAADIANPKVSPCQMAISALEPVGGQQRDDANTAAPLIAIASIQAIGGSKADLSEVACIYKGLTKGLDLAGRKAVAQAIADQLGGSTGEGFGGNLGVINPDIASFLSSVQQDLRDLQKENEKLKKKKKDKGQETPTS